MLPNITEWWQHLPPSEQIFWAIGLIFNVLFSIYVALQLLAGHDHDLGHDHDNPYWGILSIRGILAFGMFLGWTGLVALRAGYSVSIALVAGIAAGLLASWLAWRLILLLLRLQVSGTLDPEQVIGQTGAVHLVIPARQTGSGKVMVEAQGALRELEAVSEAEAIPTGSSILIVGLTPEGVFIARPFEDIPKLTDK
jgi:membrane protein implicated in regulation of membrane protease activity